jgi:fermentation-respiration switch protein FrsA (DUF1100 family)
MTLKEFLWTCSPVTLRTPPFWRRTWKHRVARLALGGLYCYVGVMIVLLLLENRLLYRATIPGQGWYEPPNGISVTDLDLTSADGTKLHGWWSTPPGWKPADGAVIFFHGNGGNLSSRGSYIPLFQKHLKTGVLLVDYPGYGRSQGSPSEAGCYASGDAAYDWLVDTQSVPASRIILVGGSLGGGIATDLAARRPHRALVLVSAFTSFPDQAQTLYPWLPARWLVRNKFNNLAKLSTVTGPVFVAHGTQDGLIPFAMSERLFAAASEPKRHFAMEGIGHTDLLSAHAFAALREFLDANQPHDPK